MSPSDEGFIHVDDETARALDLIAAVDGDLDRSEIQALIPDPTLFSQFLEEVGLDEDPFALSVFAKALVNKGVTLDQLNRPEEEIAVYDGLIARFADATEPALREQVAKALVNKGVTLGQLNRPEEEIAVYDGLIARFADATEPALREQVAKALVNKGVTLGQLNRPEEEIAVYDGLIARFAEGNPLRGSVNLSAELLGGSLVAFTGQAVEGWIAAQKNALDLMVEQSAQAVELAKEHGNVTVSAAILIDFFQKTSLLDFTVQVAEGWIGTQKRVLDLMVEQNAQALQAAKELGMNSPRSVTMLTEFVLRSAGRTLEAQKAMLDFAAIQNTVANELIRKQTDTAKAPIRAAESLETGMSRLIDTSREFLVASETRKTKNRE
jgi:tetratricopeptide (TPR) repeat protein